MKNNQKGFGAVEGLLVAIVVLLVGFIGYYVYHAQKNTDTSLNNAANTSNKSANTASSKTGSPSTKPASSTQYMTISEWGVKLPLSSDITGITYKIDTSDGVQSAAITVPNSLCTPMASIFRGSASDIDPTTQLFGSDGKTFQAKGDRQLGDYYYSLIEGNGSVCFNSDQSLPASDQDTKTQAVYLQLSTAFKNMSVAN